MALATVLGVGGELAFGSSDSDLDMRLRKAGETAMHEDPLTEPADEIACNGEVGGRGEISAATGQGAMTAVAGGTGQVAHGR